MMKFVTIIFIFLVFENSFSQTSSLGTWNILNVRYSFNPKLSFFSEGQIRSLLLYNHFHYHEIKGGLEYKTKHSVSYALGFGKYDTYREGGNFVLPKNNDELRLWPQITINNKNVWKLKFESRYRSEFRFANSNMRLRFRYRTLISYVFGKKDSKKNQIGISNELFFTNKAPYFERIRTQLFFSHQLTDKIQLFTAYLNQFDYNLKDEIGRDFLQVGLYLNFKKKLNELER